MSKTGFHKRLKKAQAHSPRIEQVGNGLRKYFNWITGESRVVKESLTPGDESVHDSRIEDEKNPKGFGTFVFLPDVHSPYEDRRALDIAINHCHKKHTPDRVVLGGDMADLFEFSNFASTPRKHPEEELEDVIAMLGFLKKSFSECGMVFLVGNHERRLVRYVQTNAPKLARSKQVSIASLLELESLGIDYHDNKESWERNGTFYKVGKLNYLHGDEIGGCGYKYAAQRMAEIYRANIIFGHLHTTDSSKPMRDLNGHVIRTWCVGCLHTRTPHYRPGASHNLGFAVVEYDNDGSGHFTVYNYLLDDEYKVRL